MSTLVGREVRLKRRPVGFPSADDFELVEVLVPSPGAGEVLVRNLWMSVDPYMRGRMYDRESYVPPFEIGKPLEGGAVGEIVESKNGALTPGDCVFSMLGWREYFVTDGTGLMKVDPSRAPLPAYLGVLGMPGLTAYVGLLDVGGVQGGETVFVTAAAGAVGSVACQIAKIRGCRVIASAGSDEKVEWLRREAGVDAAFNYKRVSDYSEKLGELCPDGIDVHFENVGGGQLEAALPHMRPFGKVVLCGMIALYNAATPPAGPSTLMLAIPKRLTLRGFIVSDHFERLGAFHADMGSWIAAEKIKWKETVAEGIENAPRAFLGLFQGENLGKMLVKLCRNAAGRSLPAGSAQ